MHSDVYQLFVIQSKCLRAHSRKTKTNKQTNILLLINLTCVRTHSHKTKTVLLFINLTALSRSFIESYPICACYFQENAEDGKRKKSGRASLWGRHCASAAETKPRSSFLRSSWTTGPDELRMLPPLTTSCWALWPWT